MLYPDFFPLGTMEYYYWTLPLITMATVVRPVVRTLPHKGKKGGSKTLT